MFYRRLSLNYKSKRAKIANRRNSIFIDTKDNFAIIETSGSTLLEKPIRKINELINKKRVIPKMKPGKSSIYCSHRT